MCMCPDQVQCNDDTRGIHGIVVLYDGHYRDQLDQYCDSAQRSPQPADALPLLGGNSERAAGNTGAARCKSMAESRIMPSSTRDCSVKALQSCIEGRVSTAAE